MGPEMIGFSFRSDSSRWWSPSSLAVRCQGDRREGENESKKPQIPSE
jgi:hypothetical protein